MIWLALAHDMHADAKLRKAKARAIWPWVLCRLKDDGGFASDNSLDPWRASDDHDGIFTEEQAATMLASLRAIGLLIRTDDGRWTTPNWIRYQTDPTAADRKRAQRAREAAQKAPKEPVTVVTRDNRDVTEVTPTGQDTTGQEQQPPKAPRGKTDDPPLAPHRPPEPQGEGEITLRDLEQLAIECIPVTSRRGKPTSIDGVSAATLAKLVAVHGAEAVRDTLQDCGGMDLPVQAAKARLSKARASPAAVAPPPPVAVVSPVPLDPEAERARTKAALAILAAGGL